MALPLPACLLIGILTVAPVAAAMGVSPFVIAQVALISGNPWFFPYQNSVYLNLMQSTEGKLFPHSSARILSSWQTGILVVAVLAAIPFWRMMVLIH